MRAATERAQTGVSSAWPSRLSQQLTDIQQTITASSVGPVNGIIGGPFVAAIAFSLAGFGVLLGVVIGVSRVADIVVLGLAQAVLL